MRSRLIRSLAHRTFLCHPRPMKISFPLKTQYFKTRELQSRFLQLSARTWLRIIVGLRGILVCVSVLYLLAFFSYSPPWPLSWGVPGKLLIAWNYAVDEIPAFILTFSFVLSVCVWVPIKQFLSHLKSPIYNVIFLVNYSLIYSC